MGMKFALLAVALALFGMAFAATNDCADGTKYFKCSSASPGYLCGPSGLVLYLKQCPCSNFPGYIETGSGDNASCILAKCSDNTQNGQCSSTKPLLCSLGQLVDNATKCGCPSGKVVSSNGLNCAYPPCSDEGTSVPDGTCSAKNERKCVNGVLVDKASECGCPAGETRDGESCGFVCEDGTKDGECSTTKPKECQNGYLLDNAQKCGCPEGKMVAGRQCTDSIIDAVTNVDLLGTGDAGNTTGQGTSPPGALSCCCLPAALIGVVGGYAFSRKRK